MSYQKSATLAAAITLACFTAAPRAQAQTTTITVTSLQDSGPGTLRAAIAQSASTPAGQSTTINFASGLSGVIPLAGTLSICNGQTLTIQGPAAAQIAISGQNTVPVLNICGGTNITISDLTIENGFGGVLPNYYAGGGGIQNLGNLTVLKSTFSGNSAGNPQVVSGNYLAPSGGGILNLNSLTVVNCTFTGNSASFGGGIANWSGLGVNATNSTFSGNSGGGVGDGTSDGSNDFHLKNSLLAGNSGGNCQSVNFTLGDQGYNLSDDASCDFYKTGDVNSTPAGLDPNGLQNNGGPTRTIALLTTSPAVDAVPVANCTDTSGNPVTTDQRGIARPSGKGCDIGAYELLQNVPFAAFEAGLAIVTDKPYGYVLTGAFTPGATSTPLSFATSAVTLQIASYSVTIPAGSLKPLGSGPNALYIFEGTLGGAPTGFLITPMGNNRYGFAASATVDLAADANPVSVTLTIGDNSGSTTASVIRLR